LVALGSVGAAMLPLFAGQLLENDTRSYLWFILLGLGFLPLILVAISRFWAATPRHPS
jgi:fucose permease